MADDKQDEGRGIVNSDDGKVAVTRDASGKVTVRKTVFKVTGGGAISGSGKSKVFVTQTTKNLGEDPAAFGMALGALREALSNSDLDPATRTSLEQAVQILEHQAGQESPSHAVIDANLKTFNAVVTRNDGAGSHLRDLVAHLGRLAKRFFGNEEA